MIEKEEARKIIDETVAPTSRTEKTELAKSYGRVLAEDVVSDIDIPPFNRVTMDGYAVVSSDGPGEYEVAEDVPAGKFPEMALKSGKVTKIMTGAPLPDGADAVVQVEKTGGFADVGQMAQINEGVGAGKNFCPKGEDIKKGDLALEPEIVIRPQEVAVLASLGYDPVKVYKLPRIAIVATGDELVEPAEKPEPGQIRNSNGYSTFSQVMAMGVEPVALGIARDNYKSLREKIEEGSKYDFLFISGGISAGDRDFVPEIVKDAGYELLFHKVKIKPGKPVMFGATKDNRYVFGVPGNPVSSMVIFELFIKPAIRKFARLPAYDGMMARATLKGEFTRKNDSRDEYLPVALKWNGSGFTASRVAYHGSGHFSAMTKANGLMYIPAGVKEIPAGGSIDVRFFDETQVSMR
ncbi:Molybdopterin molybdenumtransferase [hydrothermal vent metagenome]|uniref:molybdopterin molybdotransferase n=1 Tax=hydrothermal vent metagenome TaxID=652676 RepID=A0A3B1CB83_9ZZZZ